MDDDTCCGEDSTSGLLEAASLATFCFNNGQQIRPINTIFRSTGVLKILFKLNLGNGQITAHDSTSNT